MGKPVETLNLVDGKSIVLITPARGGLVTRFVVDGEEVLYLEEETLVDPSKNVRGGIPILFPSPGPLTNGRFDWRGLSGEMKQHGFARTLPWRVVTSGRREAVLELTSSADTRDAFPWDFALSFRYVLAGPKLSIEQTVENSSSVALPFALGLHPYFRVPQTDKPRTLLPTRATRAWDNVAKREIALLGSIDLSAEEVDLHLLDHGANGASLVLPSGRSIHVHATSHYGRWVVWTLGGRDFVCLEPWTAGADALNHGTDLFVLEPGTQKRLRVDVEVG